MLAKFKDILTHLAVQERCCSWIHGMSDAGTADLFPLLQCSLHSEDSAHKRYRDCRCFCLLLSDIYPQSLQKCDVSFGISLTNIAEKLNSDQAAGAWWRVKHDLGFRLVTRFRTNTQINIPT